METCKSNCAFMRLVEKWNALVACVIIFKFCIFPKLLKYNLLRKQIQLHTKIVPELHGFYLLLESNPSFSVSSYPVSVFLCIILYLLLSVISYISLLHFSMSFIHSQTFNKSLLKHKIIYAKCLLGAKEMWWKIFLLS